MFCSTKCLTQLFCLFTKGENARMFIKYFLFSLSVPSCSLAEFVDCLLPWSLCGFQGFPANSCLQ